MADVAGGREFVPLNAGRGGRRVGAGRKPIPEELKKERRAMRKQITISWNMCQEWETKKSQVGIKRDREFLQYLMRQMNRSSQADEPHQTPLGTMSDYTSYIHQLRAEQKLCDVTFVIKEAETSYVTAHKMVLMMTSRYFKSLSREELISRNEFYLEDVTMKGIQLLLDFMYGQVIDPVEHYKNLQQTTQAATLLQVDVYLQNARAIARRGRKLMEAADSMTSSTLPERPSNGHGYYASYEGLMTSYPVPVDELTTASSSDVEIREAEFDDGSHVSEKSANFAAMALDTSFINKGKFVCLKCEKSFKRHVILQRHVRLVHMFRYATNTYRRRKIVSYLHPTGKAENTCKFCKSSFANPLDLRRHNATVHRYIRVPKIRKPGQDNLKRIPCSLCPEIFDSKRMMKEHVLIKHRQKSERIKCTQCPRTFAVQESLDNHMKYRHSGAAGEQRHHHEHIDAGGIPHTQADRAKSAGLPAPQGPRVFDSIAALRQLVKPQQSPQQQQPVQTRPTQGKPELKCHICSLTYNHKSLLMKHIQIVHQNENNGNAEPQNRVPEQSPLPPPPPPLTRAPIVDNSETKQTWRCHLCELPFGFHWSLIRHLELVHRIVGTHLDAPKMQKDPLHELDETTRYLPKEPPSHRRSKTKTVRQLIEQNQERQGLHSSEDNGPTIKEILERKIRRREDRSLQQLEDRFGSTSMVPNTRYGDMLNFESQIYERTSPPVDYGIASPQQLTAMVQAPLLPFNTSPQNNGNKDRVSSPGTMMEFDNDGFSLPPTPEDRNARRRHRLTGQNEPVPQPPKEHERILATRVNIQRPAYSQMTFKLVKSKKDPKGESELKLWPQHREIYDCSGCGQAFSRYPSYAKHVVKCVGDLPEMPQSLTSGTEATVDKRRGPRPRPNPVKHYDFKEYCPPENKFKYQHWV